MLEEKAPEPEIVSSAINNFAYLYQDAGYLLGISKRPELKDAFEKTRLSRTALVLYIVSLEALINRAMESFAPEPLREFFLEREQKFDIKEKWLLLPMLAGSATTFDEGAYPWSHFKELVTIRNDYVHPKHARMAYYRVLGPGRWTSLDPKDIPPGFPATDKSIVYPQTKIPRDPYSVLPENVETVKKVVDDTIKELDRLLGGKVTAKWLHEDEMKPVWPPGAKFVPAPADPPKP